MPIETIMIPNRKNNIGAYNIQSGNSISSTRGTIVDTYNIPIMRVIPDAITSMYDNFEPSEKTLKKKDNATAGAIDMKII